MRVLLMAASAAFFVAFAVAAQAQNCKVDTTTPTLPSGDTTPIRCAADGSQKVTVSSGGTSGGQHIKGTRYWTGSNAAGSAAAYAAGDALSGIDYVTYTNQTPDDNAIILGIDVQVLDTTARTDPIDFYIWANGDPVGGGAVCTDNAPFQNAESNESATSTFLGAYRVTPEARSAGTHTFGSVTVNRAFTTAASLQAIAICPVATAAVTYAVANPIRYHVHGAR